MSLVNSQSPLTVLSHFEIFSNVPVQTSIEAIHNEHIRPISQLNSSNYLEFEVNSNMNEYIILEDIFIHLKFRVKLSKSEGSLALSDWDNISTVNNLLHSIFNQVDLYINGIQTTISLLTYSHKSYLLDLLYTTNSARKSYLELAGFYRDEEVVKYNRALAQIRTELIEHELNTKYRIEKKEDSEKKPAVTTAVPANPADVGTGKTVELMGRIHLDFLKQFKYLVGGSKLRFKFVLNRPEFIFMLKDPKLAPSIEFIDVLLNIPKAIVTDDLAIAQNKAIEISPCKYVFNRFEVRTATIDQGVTGKNIENCIQSQLPKKIFLAFVENIAYNGSYTENPFLFKHFDIMEVACFVNGVKQVIETDFTHRSFRNAYLELCKVCKQANNDHRMAVNLRDFENGSTIWAFDISQDHSEGYTSDGYVNPPRDGHIRFEILFRNATTKTINAIFFYDFDNQISITQNRDPIADY